MTQACLPDAARLQRAVEATWPPARTWRGGPWTYRDGAGGGKRVSAATADAPAEDDDVARALSAFHDRGEVALFQVRQGEAALDALLDRAGLAVIDPVTLYVTRLAPPDGPASRGGPPAAIAPGDAPLPAQRALWARCGIGPQRVAVMARVRGPAACLSLPAAAPPAAVLFAACDGSVAMVHALEVVAGRRRQGLGRALMQAAATWAAAQGARHLGLAVLTSNAPARALYASLGMTAVGQYHYRMEALR